ncbi:unnamed protein product [Amoebophrya sp. A25]|nr:unnamed protein product [Amoebophrya sp. A25]|eukprot:GSA25T00002914001.1
MPRSANTGTGEGGEEEPGEGEQGGEGIEESERVTKNGQAAYGGAHNSDATSKGPSSVVMTTTTAPPPSTSIARAETSSAARPPGGGSTNDFQNKNEYLPYVDAQVRARLALLQRKKNGAENKRTRVIVAANRLPVTLKKSAETGRWSGTKSSGGLVTGLSAVRGMDMIWVGWCGAEIPEDDRKESFNCYPVWLSQQVINLYYNGFANNVIWPLFHYVMPPLPVHGENETFFEQWLAYEFANEMFTQAIAEVYEPDACVWVQDYHLMLVPRQFRQRFPDAHIGWFLHTPFPASEYYRTLKVREELLYGVLSANLVAFHVYDYIRHFLSSVVQLTSLETSPTGVDATPIGGCFVKCATIPIGIEPSLFVKALAEPTVEEQVELLSEQFDRRKVILGVDRLDYMKGIPHKLRAFDRFLSDHPEWVGDCVLVQVAVPSRQDVKEYQKLKKLVHEMVGEICGRHSSLSSAPPVVYLDKSVGEKELAALYRVADVCLITSVRDGMNLVSYEFVACQEGKHGVLILSEFAGAVQSLGAGSIRVNPWDLSETAAAIHQALTMGAEEKAARHDFAWRIVHKYTAQKWAETFIQTLKEATVESEEFTARVPPLLPYEELLEEMASSKKRLLLVDLLDCLVPSKVKRNLPIKLYQSLLVVPAQVLSSLAALAYDPDTTVVIVTMHQRAVVERLFGHLPIILAAENGCSYRSLDGEWRSSVDSDTMLGAGEWMDGCMEIFTYFKERTPGSYTERTEYSVQWYFDNTQTDFGAQQARELLIYLWAGPLVNSEAEVCAGSRSICVRPHGTSRAVNIVTILRNELGQELLDSIDWGACFAQVPFRDDTVFEAIEELLTVEVDQPAQEQGVVATATAIAPSSDDPPMSTNTSSPTTDDQIQLATSAAGMQTSPALVGDQHLPPDPLKQREPVPEDAPSSTDLLTKEQSKEHKTPDKNEEMLVDRNHTKTSEGWQLTPSDGEWRIEQDGTSTGSPQDRTPALSESNVGLKKQVVSRSSGQKGPWDVNNTSAEQCQGQASASSSRMCMLSEHRNHNMNSSVISLQEVLAKAVSGGVASATTSAAPPLMSASAEEELHKSKGIISRNVTVPVPPATTIEVVMMVSNEMCFGNVNEQTKDIQEPEPPPPDYYDVVVLERSFRETETVDQDNNKNGRVGERTGPRRSSGIDVGGETDVEDVRKDHITTTSAEVASSKLQFEDREDADAKGAMADGSTGTGSFISATNQQDSSSAFVDTGMGNVLLVPQPATEQAPASVVACLLPPKYDEHMPPEQTLVPLGGSCSASAGQSVPINRGQSTSRTGNIESSLLQPTKTSRGAIAAADSDDGTRRPASGVVGDVELQVYPVADTNLQKLPLLPGLGGIPLSGPDHLSARGGAGNKNKSRSTPAGVDDPRGPGGTPSDDSDTASIRTPDYPHDNQELWPRADAFEPPPAYTLPENIPQRSLALSITSRKGDIMRKDTTTPAMSASTTASTSSSSAMNAIYNRGAGRRDLRRPGTTAIAGGSGGGATTKPSPRTSPRVNGSSSSRGALAQMAGPSGTSSALAPSGSAASSSSMGHSLGLEAKKKSPRTVAADVGSATTTSGGLLPKVQSTPTLLTDKQQQLEGRSVEAQVSNKAMTQLAAPSTTPAAPTTSISYFSVSLGKQPSRARYSLPNPYHVQNLLQAMVERLPQAAARSQERSRAVLVGPEKERV